MFDKGIVRFEEEATFSAPKFSLRLGHARGLTVHRTVIQYPRAATLRIYIRREEGNGGRKRPLNQRNPSDFYLKLSHLWFLLYLRWFLGIFRSFSVLPNVTAPFISFYKFCRGTRKQFYEQGRVLTCSFSFSIASFRRIPKEYSFFPRRFQAPDSPA